MCYARITLLFEVFTMLIPDALTDKILVTAKQEFLKNGFEKASMRVIARNSGVTTGALYTRFASKDDLFATLVNPFAEEFVRIDTEWKISPAELWQRKFNAGNALIEHIYADKDTFKLLFTCAAGSSQENFIDRIIKIEVNDTLAFIDNLSEGQKEHIKVSNEALYILAAAHCRSLFEISYLDISLEEAKKQVTNIMEFFMCGWSKILGF